MDEIAGILAEATGGVEAPVKKKKEVAPEIQVDEQESENEPNEDEDEEPDGEGEEEQEAQEQEEATWAGVLGLDEKQVVIDEKGELKGVVVKVDGEINTVDIPTLIAGFQTNKHNTRTSQTLAEERKQLDTVRQEVLTAYRQKLTDAEKLTEYLSSNLMKEYQSIDWDQLRMTNPGEYAASVQDYNMKKQEVEKVFEAIKQEKANEQERVQQESQQQRQTYLAQQVDILKLNNPTWTDKAVMKQAFEGFKELITHYGYEPEEFDQVLDARVIEILKDVQKYRKGLTVATKKIKPEIPRFQKSGNKVVNKTKLQQLTEKAKAAKGYHKRGAETDALSLSYYQEYRNGNY